MKKLLLFLLVTFTTILSIHWVADRFSDTSDQELPSSVWFFNSSTGWISIPFHKDTIYRTTNWGLNWISYSTGDTNSMTSLYFINQNTGWGVGRKGVIKKTSNGGLNWSVYSTGQTQTLNQVNFCDSLNGFAVGGYESSRIILKTTNGGINWQNIVSPGTTRLFSVFMISLNNIYAIGDSGTIIYSSNGGANWINQISNTNSILRKIKFKTSSFTRGYIAGKNGTVLTTTNGGINWINHSFNANNFYALEVTSVDTAYIAGQYGKIYKTINGGINWFQQQTPLDTTGFLKDIFFVNSVSGWAINLKGQSIYTNNGGVIGIRNIMTELPSNYNLFQNYPNPFNPTTKIQFAIPKNGFVKLTVFDITGKTMAVLANETMQPGTYEVEWDASHRSSGIYFYKLETENYSQTKRMVLIK